MTDIVKASTVTPTTSMQEWSVISQQAEILARSDIVPRAYRGKPANVIAAAISGRSFGWDAMAAMRNCHVIEGQVSIKPEAQVGLVRAAGHSITGTSSSEAAEVTGKRGDTGDQMTVRWTLEDAKAAGLLGKSNWRQYPSDMLWARAVSQLCRRLFPDVTLGLSYTPDELGDEEPVEEPVAVAVVVDPPEGWDSWDECDASHDALRERVKQASATIRNKWTGYMRDATHGEVAPWPKPVFLDLEGTFEIIEGENAHRSSSADAATREGADPVLVSPGSETSADEVAVEAPALPSPPQPAPPATDLSDAITDALENHFKYFETWRQQNDIPANRRLWKKEHKEAFLLWYAENVKR